MNKQEKQFAHEIANYITSHNLKPTQIREAMEGLLKVSANMIKAFKDDKKGFTNEFYNHLKGSI